MCSIGTTVHKSNWPLLVDISVDDIAAKASSLRYIMYLQLIMLTSSRITHARNLEPSLDRFLENTAPIILPRNALQEPHSFLAVRCNRVLEAIGIIEVQVVRRFADTLRIALDLLDPLLRRILHDFVIARRFPARRELHQDQIVFGAVQAEHIASAGYTVLAEHMRQRFVREEPLHVRNVSYGFVELECDVVDVRESGQIVDERDGSDVVPVSPWEGIAFFQEFRQSRLVHVVRQFELGGHSADRDGHGW
jgi:hypothetical protein